MMTLTAFAAECSDANSWTDVALLAVLIAGAVAILWIVAR